MAKLPAKKPKLTPEEQLAELAALTGDVAAINLMHPSAPVATPAPVPAVASPVSPPEPVAPASVTAPAVASPNPAPAATAEPVTSAPLPADGVGEGQPKGKSKPISAPTPEPTVQSAAEALAPAPEAAAAAPVDETVEEDETPEEEVAEPVAVAAPVTGAVYKLDALFEPSKEKKTVMMRITPALHQYFQQIGLLLGDGTSVPDVVHNILTEWKSLHEKEVQKALQKQMRLMLKNTM